MRFLMTPRRRSSEAGRWHGFVSKFSPGQLEKIDVPFVQQRGFVCFLKYSNTIQKMLQGRFPRSEIVDIPQILKPHSQDCFFKISFTPNKGAASGRPVYMHVSEVGG